MGIPLPFSERSLFPACHQVTRTWRRGNNADFLGRVAKLAVRRKWASLIAAFRTALRKVLLCIALTTSPAPQQSAAMLMCAAPLRFQHFTTGIRCAQAKQDAGMHRDCWAACCFAEILATLAQVEASADTEPPASASDTAAAGAERPPKRARLGPGTAGAAPGAQRTAVGAAVSGAGPVGKSRAAEAPSPAVLREWRRFAEQLGAAERAAQAAEVCCRGSDLPDSSVALGAAQSAHLWLPGMQHIAKQSCRKQLHLYLLKVCLPSCTGWLCIRFCGGRTCDRAAGRLLALAGRGALTCINSLHVPDIFFAQSQ
jgi:hypothetical protein